MEEFSVTLRIDGFILELLALGSKVKKFILGLNNLRSGPLRGEKKGNFAVFTDVKEENRSLQKGLVRGSCCSCPFPLEVASFHSWSDGSGRGRMIGQWAHRGETDS